MSTGTGASDLLHAEDTAIDEIVAGKAPVAARSPLQLFWRRLRKDKVALGAGIWRWYHFPHSYAEVGRWTVDFMYLPMLAIVLARAWPSKTSIIPAS